MRDIKKEILNPNKIVLWVVGVIATFIITFIFTIITFLGLLSQWFLLAIPVFCLIGLNFLLACIKENLVTLAK